MSKLNLGPVCLAIALGGCRLSSSPPSEPSSSGSSELAARDTPGIPAVTLTESEDKNWGPDTLPAIPSSELRWVRMTNMSMAGPGPAGLFVQLPRHSRTKPILSDRELSGLPGGKSARDYNLALVIATESGGEVSLQLAQLPLKEFRDFDKVMAAPPAQSSACVARPWRGFKTTMPGGTAYTMVHSPMLLIVTGAGPTEVAKREADEACRAIIRSVRIDPAAKPIDFFPGAGEEENRPIPKGTEIAMPDGMKIRATTKVGVIEIEAGPMSKRTYTWEGATRSVIMDARTERWYGSLGMYYPGPGDHWKEHNGITRAVVEEGQQHFKTVEEALKWIRENSWEPSVYRDDGLVVMWGKVLERRQLNVDVWQILINGKKPTRLPGSKNSAIEVLSPGRR